MQGVLVFKKYERSLLSGLNLYGKDYKIINIKGNDVKYYQLDFNMLWSLKNKLGLGSVLVFYNQMFMDTSVIHVNAKVKVKEILENCFSLQVKTIFSLRMQLLHLMKVLVKIKK